MSQNRNSMPNTKTASKSSQPRMVLARLTVSPGVLLKRDFDLK